MSRYFIIGSTGLCLANFALKALADCKDTDILLPENEPKPRIRQAGLPKREFHYNTEVFETVKKYVHKNCLETHILPVSILLSIKLSHLHYNLKNQSWGKHFKDCITLLEAGYTPNRRLVKELRTIWERKYGGKDKIKLNKQASDFFKQKYNQNHDKLHEYFKLKNKPAYQCFLKWGSEVMPSKSLFEIQDKETQFNSVAEEAMVIAYERNLSLMLGFKKLITDLSKGWWNLFIIENLSDLYRYLKDKENHFKQVKHYLNTYGV